MSYHTRCYFTPLHSSIFLFSCTILHTKPNRIKFCRRLCNISALFCVKRILDLQFGCTGSDRHFCTLAYTQPQPPFRQRFPLCFPESVCRKSMAVDLGRGPYAARVTQGMGELMVGKMKRNIQYIQLSWRVT